MAVFSWSETVGIPQCSRQISMSHPFPAARRFKDEQQHRYLADFSATASPAAPRLLYSKRVPLMPFAQAYDGPIYFENANGLAVDEHLSFEEEYYNPDSEADIALQSCPISK